jgi:hypothetical protein
MNRLIFRSLITALVLFVAFCVPSIASADGITWNLTGVTFDDGGTASGSFNYNAVTNTFSSIDITTTVGSAFGGATYTTLSGAFPGSSTSTSLFLGASSGSFTGLPLFLLLFDAPLINSGGTVTDPLTTGLDFGGGEGTCDNADCSSSTEARFITGGAATSTVVAPEPSALSLLGVGLAALLAGAVIRRVSQA